MAHMKAVGVKALKARLSEYLRLVKSGETILVTEREEVVAELRPARRRQPPAGDVEEALDALAERGEVTRAALPKGEWTFRTQGLGLPPGTAARLLDELRADRDEDL
jgi:antitoxin (DNA-binding transcriptional repressor) of toxin-antitoxin stability system